MNNKTLLSNQFNNQLMNTKDNIQLNSIISLTNQINQNLTIDNVIDFFMVIGPCFGFIIQILKIKETKTSEGFNKLLILILLVANILRIFFWIGKPFSKVLLYQSIVMIFTQLYLLHVCLIYSEFQLKQKKNESTRYDFSFNNLKSNLVDRTLLCCLSIFDEFWVWKNYFEYFLFVCVFTSMITLLTNIFTFRNLSYVEFLGLFSAGVEAMFGLPQLVLNYMNSSTGALSTGMVFTWIFGDSFKTYYFYHTSAPFQLLYCGIFQLSIDVLIIYQIFAYSKIDEDKTYTEISTDENEDCKIAKGQREMVCVVAMDASINLKTKKFIKTDESEIGHNEVFDETSIDVNVLKNNHEFFNLSDEAMDLENSKTNNLSVNNSL